MPTVVNTCWGPRHIDDQPYWHLVAAGGLFYNNVRAGKGALLSVSAAIEAEPAIENAHTPYSLSRMQDGKEKIFEEIRKSKYPNCPSRLKSLYVFDDYGLVERALKEWFPNERKTPRECRLLLDAVTHKADTVWLNANSDQWMQNSEKYWQGEMTQSPFPEVLIHGALYFPDWQTYPAT
jgi:hypothetical protein